MRSLIELYNILFEYRRYRFTKYQLGICNNVYLLFKNGIITKEERLILNKDLDENLPNGRGGFNWYPEWRWQRDKFIKNRIKELI